MAALVLLPVTLLAFLPSVLGLERYVISTDSMQGDIDRGSLAIERPTPAEDLVVGDVITFPSTREVGTTVLVTQRVVAVNDRRLVTRGDTEPASLTETLPVDGATYSRVLVHVPWVGYPFLGAVDRSMWVALILTAIGALAMAWQARPQPGPRPGSRVPLG
ncbi:hypothetical protein [Nocardioides sp. SYSU D00038]|uniref:hypothetical protein n=1 Tax=Nocardioides sp. SYSU D00038 TaxID=2812554 RepID=UPI0019672DBB|nr:hypothetical protein [Nocardioides sp. SYSU D00038]